MDASYPSKIEEDPFENLSDVADLFREKLGIETTEPERKIIRRLAELIGERSARFSVCGIAAICQREVTKPLIVLLTVQCTTSTQDSKKELHKL